MPAIAIFILGAALIGYALVAPVGRALALLIAVTFILPPTLLFPNGYISYTSIDRMVLIAVALNLVIRYARHEFRLDVFKATAVHAAFVWFIAVALTCGVLIASINTPHAAAMSSFVGIVEQFIFFVVCLACIRHINDDRRVVSVIGAVVIATAAIAVAEHATGHSWGHFLFRGLPNQSATSVAARPLEMREGAGRVRAGAEFALQYAWMTAAAVPLILALIAVSRRRMAVLWGGGLALMGMGMVWSYSRTALFGVAAGVLLAWLLSGFNRRIGLMLSCGPALAWSVGHLSKSIAFRLSFAADPGSALGRQLKLPLILSIVSTRPIQGIGLSGLDFYGLTEVDESFVSTYAQLGLVGVLSLIVLLAVGAVMAVRAALVSFGPERVLAAGVAGGVVATIASGLTYDALNLQGSTRELWLLVALAVAIGERSVARKKDEADHEAPDVERDASGGLRLSGSPHFSEEDEARPRGARRRALGLQAGWYRVAFPAIGVAVGLVVASAAPRHVVGVFTVASLPVYRSFLIQDPIDRADPAGVRLIATECHIVRGLAHPYGVKADCGEVIAHSTNAEKGEETEFLVRLEAPTRAQLVRVFDATYTFFFVTGFPGAVISINGAPKSGTPALLRTAPISGGLLGGAFGALCPLPQRKRRRRRRRQHGVSRGPAAPAESTGSMVGDAQDPAELQVPGGGSADVALPSRRPVGAAAP
jgi:hypothetical protein